MKLEELANVSGELINMNTSVPVKAIPINQPRTILNDTPENKRKKRRSNYYLICKNAPRRANAYMRGNSTDGLFAIQYYKILYHKVQWNQLKDNYIDWDYQS